MFDDDNIKAWSRLSKFAQTKVPLWALVLVACVAAVAGQQVSGLQRESKGAPADLAQRNATLSLATVNCDMLRQQNEDAHLLFGTAFAWAVRSAMMRNNVDQVDVYFTQLLKNRSIDLAVLADRRGKVLLATDKQLRGARLSSHFPQAALSEEEVRLERMDGNQMRLILPIHGLTRRLGTVVLTYTVP